MNEQEEQQQQHKHPKDPKDTPAHSALQAMAKTTAPRGYFFIRHIKRVTAPDTYSTYVSRERQGGRERGEEIEILYISASCVALY